MEFSIYAANLCHYQQFADILKQKRDTVGYEQAYQYAYDSAKTSDGKNFLQSQVTQKGINSVVDQMINIYQITPDNYHKDEVPPENYFDYTPIWETSGSYILLVLYMLIGLVSVYLCFALVRAVFYYIITGALMRPKGSNELMKLKKVIKFS